MLLRGVLRFFEIPVKTSIVSTLSNRIGFGEYRFTLNRSSFPIWAITPVFVLLIVVFIQKPISSNLSINNSLIGLQISLLALAGANSIFLAQIVYSSNINKLIHQSLQYYLGLLPSVLWILSTTFGLLILMLFNIIIPMKIAIGLSVVGLLQVGMSIIRILSGVRQETIDKLLAREIYSVFKKISFYQEIREKSSDYIAEKCKYLKLMQYKSEIEGYYPVLLKSNGWLLDINATKLNILAKRNGVGSIILSTLPYNYLASDTHPMPIPICFIKNNTALTPKKVIKCFDIKNKDIKLYQKPWELIYSFQHIVKSSMDTNLVEYQRLIDILIVVFKDILNLYYSGKRSRSVVEELASKFDLRQLFDPIIEAGFENNSKNVRTLTLLCISQLYTEVTVWHSEDVLLTYVLNLYEKGYQSLLKNASDLIERSNFLLKFDYDLFALLTRGRTQTFITILNFLAKQSFQHIHTYDPIDWLNKLMNEYKRRQYSHMDNDAIKEWDCLVFIVGAYYHKNNYCIHIKTHLSKVDTYVKTFCIRPDVLELALRKDQWLDKSFITLTPFKDALIEYYYTISM